MSTFSDSIAEVLAEQPVAEPAPAPLSTDFGSDLACLDDLGAMGEELAADDPQVVEQRFYRWCKTEPGTFPDLEVKDWGGGLPSMLRRAMTPAEIASLPGRLRSKWLQDDEQTEEISISLPQDQGGGQYLIDVQGSTAEGPFGLTLAASSTDVILKAMRQQ
jgi:hypothetical protein